MVADKAGLSTITENPFNVEQVRKLFPLFNGFCFWWPL